MSPRDQNADGMDVIEFNREQILNRLRSEVEWDVLVIGGGATGGGIAVDAASRGFRTLLLEQSDFGKGTSSRSTKLIHGGVRYLEQGNLPLVREALLERGRLLRNAPHLVQPLTFVLPTFKWWEKPYYSVGLRLYDWLSGNNRVGRSRQLSREEATSLIPGLNDDRLRGGVLYHDAQFDDAGLVLSLMRTATREGAACLNYCRVENFLKENGRLTGAEAIDVENGKQFSIRARCVINATGPFSDRLRKSDNADLPNWISPSRGIHLVVDSSFLGGETALLVPKTDDGRIIFVIPWQGRCLIGTTDTPIDGVPLEPGLLSEEVDFLLETAGRYLLLAPTREDVLGTFSGIRPLVSRSSNKSTSRISREHEVEISDSGLITIAGGKWTTYRQMAEDALDRAMQVGILERRECVTRALKLAGHPELDSCNTNPLDQSNNPDSILEECLDPRIELTNEDVVRHVRFEMARTVEDVLSRRSRTLLLDARGAQRIAEPVARILAKELSRPEAWVADQIREFTELAENSLRLK